MERQKKERTFEDKRMASSQYHAVPVSFILPNSNSGGPAMQDTSASTVSTNLTGNVSRHPENFDLNYK